MKRTITNLLALALMLSLFSCVSQVNDTVKAVDAKLQSLFNPEQKEDLEKELEGSSTTVTVDDKGVLTTTFQDSMTFALNSADLQPAAKSEIRKIAGVLAKYKDSEVRVFGHTDAKGSAAYNMTLSEKRAMAVKTELLANGFKGEVVTVGYGETNSVSKDHALNRRVEIKINDVVPLATIQAEINKKQQALITQERELVKIGIAAPKTKTTVKPTPKVAGPPLSKPKTAKPMAKPAQKATPAPVAKTTPKPVEPVKEEPKDKPTAAAEAEPAESKSVDLF